MDYRSSRAWQRSDDLAVAVYEASRSFPKEETYGLTSQMRRAAVSIPANIAEGSGRNTKREYLHFLYVARGSLREVEYYVHLAHRLGHIDDDTTDKLDAAVRATGSALYGLIRHWEAQSQEIIGLSVSQLD